MFPPVGRIRACTNRAPAHSTHAADGRERGDRRRRGQGRTVARHSTKIRNDTGGIVLREIKFRAWDKQEKKFIEWTDDLFISCSGKIFENDYEDNEDGTPIECLNGFELEQFTGLHDKNGKEIYEGDITKDSTGLCLVVWNPFFACFSLRRDGWMFDHFFGEAVDPFNCEILGNIHENPELLNAR